MIRLLGAAVFAACAAASGQVAAPGETRGVTVKPLAVVDLAPEIEGMAGRELRSRLVTVEPRGVLASHNHRDRPGTVYVLQGRIKEHRGGVTKEYGLGQAWTEDAATTHWLENDTTEPAVLVAVDVFRRP